MPVPGVGQVRVAVAAAAVNFPDVLIIANRYQLSVPPPFTPGSEFSGIVDAVGEGVDRWRVGDRVFGAGMIGAFAEQVITSAATLRRAPEGADLVRDGRVLGGVGHRLSRPSFGRRGPNG